MAGMISQWAGEAVQAVNWRRSEPLLMMQAFLLNEIFDAPLSLKNVLEPYHLYSVHTRSEDRKSTRLNSSHVAISYAVFCLKKKMTDDEKSFHDLTFKQKYHPER